MSILSIRFSLVLMGRIFCPSFNFRAACWPQITQVHRVFSPSHLLIFLITFHRAFHRVFSPTHLLIFSRFSPCFFPFTFAIFFALCAVSKNSSSRVRFQLFSFFKELPHYYEAPPQHASFQYASQQYASSSTARILPVSRHHTEFPLININI
jgi:hypothetical protein